MVAPLTAFLTMIHGGTEPEEATKARSRLTQTFEKLVVIGCSELGAVV